MPSYMTKAEAMRYFMETHMPTILEREHRDGGGVDVIMRREAWSDYTDYLCKDGLISLKQYETWTNPF